MPGVRTWRQVIEVACCGVIGRTVARRSVMLCPGIVVLVTRRGDKGVHDVTVETINPSALD